MSNTYIASEVKKVIETAEYPKNISLACAWIIAHFKGLNIKIFDVTETSSLCDYNIIASAENTTQARAMVDEIVKNLKEQNLEVVSLEGMGDADWVLIDMGDVIIHIFQEISRDIFDLDSLWEGHEQIQIPQEYYFGEAPESNQKDKSSTSNYF